jgi:tetratricopeptide (TPR) repeat protein
MADISTQDLDLYWFPDDPARSEREFRAKLAELQGQEAKDHAFQAEILTQIARAEAAQGKITEASASLAAASNLLGEVASEESLRARIRLLLQEGRLFVIQRTPAPARTRFNKAWVLSVNAGEDCFVIDVAREMAGIEPQKFQEVWIRKAIEIAEGSSQEKARFWLGDLYAELGWRLFDLRQFDAALVAHQSSLACHQQRGCQLGIYQARWAVGRLLRQLRRVPEALAWNETLMLEMDTENPLYGRLCEEVAECLLSLNRPEVAQVQFAHAYHELSRAKVVDRHPLGLKRLKQLGKVD